MGDYGQAAAGAFKAMLILGIISGAVGVLVAWALWHFVFSHLTIGWV